MSKIYTIFYSWQSDTKDSSRKIIEKALAEAKKKLLDNKGISIEIDHSTLGECGMPSIDQTILKRLTTVTFFYVILRQLSNMRRKREMEIL